ncbi:MAG: UvrD-helicase domain-containing protein [Emergencia sp.]|jgi:DNA helicase-2/ATP-dependent DNA helicase PcrA|nr:UvrD-helicase domain-containing protein [Emergencia sp.]
MSLDRLNDKQRQAAMMIEGPLLILAGAGSGKTSTMTERIAYMIEQGISPYHLLAVTFTNKAAAEMRSRVEDLVGSCRDMWIMTFHSMCLRILRYHCEIIGYDHNFVIYDSTDQKTIVKNIIKAQNINDKEFGAPYLLSIISSFKEKAVDAEGYRKTMEDNFKTKIIYNVFKAYEEELRKNNAMDFDDLLLNTVRLFEADEAILLKYQNRFRYIMVDEYQDTNHIQYKLIKMLAEGHHNLCVVGDDDQCIYQWRGADIRNILDFEKDFPEAKVVKLEQNYRSVGNILAAAHSVIENNHGRKGKKLWTEKEAGDKIKYYRADTEKDEARFVAQQIDLMKTRERKFSDFAILYRTNAQSRHFEEALTARDIPYRVLSGLRYYDRKEIKDVMAYMRLVVNPYDDLSFKRVVNEPKRGMGDKSVEKVEAFAKVRGESLLQALSDEEVLSTLPSKAYAGVKAMVECINLCRAERENLRVSDIYDNLLVKTGYMKALEDANTVEAEGRIENLMEFKSVIYDYEDEAENPTIEEFMEKITLMAEVDNHDESQDAVVLMTMHSAKGLEFPVVFLPGLEDGLFPGHKAFDTPTGMEEERRLCYVGMTRAKETLILCSAAMRTLYGRTDYTRESQFLREVDKRLLEGDAVYVRKSRDSGLGVSTGSIDGYATKESPKPYDALRFAKAATCANVSAAAGGEDFAIGDRVRHAKFGEGLVIDQDDKTMTVIFDAAGQKKMAKGIAPLKKI